MISQVEVALLAVQDGMEEFHALLIESKGDWTDAVQAQYERNEAAEVAAIEAGATSDEIWFALGFPACLR